MGILESGVAYTASSDIAELAYSGRGIAIVCPYAINNQYGIEGVKGWYSREDLLQFLRFRCVDFIYVELGPGKVKHAPLGIGLNQKADPSADIWYDLNGGIPLPDESVDNLYSNQFLEHLHKERQVFFWNEMWRVLKPSGTMEHTVPHYLSPDADGDPTHFTRYSENSFQYYCLDREGRPFVESFSDYGIKCRFEMVEMKVRHRVDIRVVMRKPDAP